MRLKVEINSREHFTVHGFTSVPFAVSSRWFEGSCQITSYELDELLGTKLRALYQRRKGRDLFDLATALKNPTVDPTRIIAAFSAYMDQGGHNVTREQFERNLAAKLHDPQFTADIGPLLAPGYSSDIANAAKTVSSSLIALL
jgi:predicted nucleotidyltransferase component of viral defense system